MVEKDQPTERTRPRWPREVAALLLLTACAGASTAGFALATTTDYLTWYVTNGTGIALVTGLVSLTIDLDRLPMLISPRPATFLRACGTVLTLPVLAWAPALLPEGSQVKLATDPHPEEWDRLFASDHVLDALAGEPGVKLLSSALVDIVEGAPDGRPSFLYPVRLWNVRATGTRPEITFTAEVDGMPQQPGDVRAGRRPLLGNAHSVRVVEGWSAATEQAVYLRIRDGVYTTVLRLRPGGGTQIGFDRLGWRLLVIIPILLMVLVAFAAWFVVLAPLQYLMFAVLGTPVRALRQHALTVVYGEDGKMELHHATRPVLAGFTEVQVFRRPVTTTVALTSLVLWIISLFL